MLFFNFENIFLRYISKSLIGYVVLLHFSVAFAQIAVTPDGYVEKKRGDGWRLLSPAVPAKTAVAQNENLIAVDSIAGLKTAPLPKVILDELASDPDLFGSSPKNSISPAALTPNNSAVFVHQGMAEAIAKGEEGKYAQYIIEEDREFDAQAGFRKFGFFFCKNKWKSKSKGRTVDLEKFIPELLNNKYTDGGFSGSISGKIPAKGQVDFSFGYSYKYNVCFPIPYALRLDGINAKGEITLEKSIFSMNGKFTAATGWQSQDYNIIKGKISFSLGPIPVKLVYQLDTYFGYEAGITLAGNVKFDNPLSGTYKFDYSCSLSDCSGTNISNIQFIRDSSPLSASISIDAEVQPYIGLRLSGYLWEEWLARGAIGAEIATKLGFFGIVDTNCGDGDADGKPDLASGLALDATAQIAIYGQWAILGNKRAKWLDMNIRPSGWDNVKTKSMTNRIASNEFNAIQRSLFFKDLTGSRRISAFSPIIMGANKIDAGEPSQYILSMRNCLPERYKNKLKYLVEWGDGKTEEVSSPDKRTMAITHQWDNPGYKTVNVIAKSDHIGRNFNTKSSRIINVEQATRIAKSVWLTTPPLVASSKNAEVRQLRTIMDKENLYVMIEKTRRGVRHSLFINSDGKKETGHQSYLWGLSSGADFSIFDGILFASTSTEWGWSNTGFPVNLVIRDKYYEYTIPLAAFGRNISAKNLSIAFFEQDFKYGVVDKIPEGNAFAALDKSIIESAHVDFWASTPILSEVKNQNISSMKANIRNGYLFVRLEGNVSVPTYSLLINADGNRNTGFQSYAWPEESGADFMVSASGLFRSYGNTALWQWQQLPGEIGVTILDKSIEFRIPLAKLNLSASQKPNIKIGFNLVDNKFNAYSKLPNGNSFVAVNDFTPTPGVKK